MKNSEFLKTLQQHYKHFDDAIDMRIGAKDSGNSLAQSIQKDSMEALSKILFAIEKRYSDSGEKAPEKAHEVLSRLAKTSPEIQKQLQKLYILEEIPTVDELLDRVHDAVGEILVENAIKVPDMFLGSFARKEIKNIGENVPAYQTLIKVLIKNNINFENVLVISENPEAIWDSHINFSHHIVYLLGENPITIVLSNNKNEQALVYFGYISAQKLTYSQYGDNIDDTDPKKLSYDENFENNLENAIFGLSEFSNEDNDNTQELDAQKIQYHAKILTIFPELQRRGMRIEGGRIDIDSFPSDIRGLSVREIFDKDLNKKLGIGTKNGAIVHKQDLINLLKVLDFEFFKQKYELSEEERIEVENYKKEFDEIFLPQLRELGLTQDDDGSFFVGNLEGGFRWRAQHKRKTLGTFPSSDFNIKYHLGNKNGHIYSKWHLADLLRFFGYKVRVR